MDREFDVLHSYKNISNKVRKRFLKKPNFAEASDQFGTLAKALKQQECPQYAGFCLLAKARCENTQGNASLEAEALVESARMYFKAESDNLELRCPAFEEHLVEAIHCYNQATKLYLKEGHPSLAAMLCIELASSLEEANKQEEAFHHYLRASDIQKQYSIVDSLSSGRKAAICKIFISDYDKALDVLTDISQIIEALEKETGYELPLSLTEMKRMTEIDIILLLLLLQSSATQLQPEHGRVMETYTWGHEEKAETSKYSEELFYLLQSTIMAAQSKDFIMLKELEGKLQSYLSLWQLQMIHNLIDGTGNLLKS